MALTPILFFWYMWYAGPRMRRWMFIQMEYCYTTLREVIDQGQLWQQPAECGKLLRQVLEALVYIHDRRVIHRDLKPANIFLDAEGNIKIGDFGLATFTTDSSGGSAGRLGASASEPNLYNLSLQRGGAEGVGNLSTLSRDGSNLSLAQLDTNNTDGLSNSLTGGIGTAMYRAPEQEYRPRESMKDTKDSAAATPDKTYDDKADMFSLGVILFEMCHPPFGTGMERLMVMKRLRDNAELPPGFGESYSTEAMANIVRWLVQRQPSQRPTAAQLLASSLVPARVDTDARYLREITEALWKPNSSAAMNIISVLFNNSLQKQSAGPMLAAGQPGSGKSGAQSAPVAFTAFTRALQDALPAVSYDLDVLQHSLNTLQPRKVPRALVGNWFTATGASATKAAKQALRQALHKERAVVTLQYTTALKQRLRLVFEAHGAVHYSPGLLQLRNNPGLALIMRNADRAVARLHSTACTTNTTGDDKGVPGSVCSPALAQFLDPVGQVVVLPSDLVTPFAKLVAFLNLQHSQRYNLGQVYTSLVPPDSPTIEDTPVVAGHDHPFISEEAVYDVVLPLQTNSAGGTGANAGDSAAAGAPTAVTVEQSTVLQADFEVLTAAIECMSKVQPYLPDCAIRVTDPRLMDTILELCAMDILPAEPATVARKGSSTATAAAAGAPSGDVYDRESLFKIISLASDGILTAAEVARLITELHTPPQFQKRLLGFVSVFCAVQDRRGSTSSSGASASTGSYLQQGTSANAGRDPLLLLDALEQVCRLVFVYGVCFSVLFWPTVSLDLCDFLHDCGRDSIWFTNPVTFTSIANFVAAGALRNSTAVR
jgi:serine/threonine protein kinase